MKNTVFVLLTIVLTSIELSAQPIGKLLARVWLGGTTAAFDGTGAEISGGTTHLFYDRRGEAQRIESSSFISAAAIGFDWTNYETNVFVYTNGGPYVVIDDSVSLSNGYPIEIEHSVTTSTDSDNGFQTVTDQTITVPGGPSSQTITTTTGASSTNYYRYFTEARDTNGNLVSWSLSSETNDSLRAQQFTLYESGGNDEANPYFVLRATNSFDSLGNVILSTSDVEFGGYVFLTVTSNSYVINQKGRVLSSISQFDSGADGTIESVTVTTFTYDKFGNVTGQAAKQFAGDGTFQGEVGSSFIYDQFGNRLYTESESLDANRAVLLRTTDAEIYVPRGQGFGHAPAAQRFLDWIRARGPHRMPPVVGK